ncbi:hypothetical protein A3C89_01070 [Candidatus Kaiserbacteria bacterium RIFCSPHIGHO2_02_FULL_50_50]|uniref:Nudix hydrolase domain-containing protein n=1 Tax=Candidatus Kaiserbacteria bacterium RIFCSPHIGHO2_02_FULL_50_50 TaxID=1798492 RepID=A0A1F6DDM8_9BACT|nr:MAG: hypothetical protein A3C89_01070 [Candidatus Kaiserbacteria bacterium RIFCSPHIGHO2_02_FULL_50_50]OGG88713.1 MAG: hypothetical protein A3G62_00470 [Candidatus Kaiserbacteria bacterium RIFCSPLOWO2_12_FULL_50_10]
MKPRQRAKALITRRDGMHVGVRGWLEPWRRRWSLPGGGLEQGETPEEALWRELEEEIAFTCPGDNLHTTTYLGAHTHWVFYIGLPYKTVTHLFRIELRGDITLSPSREIRVAQWVHPDAFTETLAEYTELLKGIQKM